MTSPWECGRAGFWGTHVRSPGLQAECLKEGWVCEGDLKFEFLVFLAAPTTVLGLSLPFLLLNERKRKMLQQVKQSAGPENKGGQLDTANMSVEKVLKLDSQTWMSPLPSLCLSVFILTEGSPLEHF